LIASVQKSPLFCADKYICSSKSLKFYTAKITALEAIAPTVKWGYLDLNQADKAPGYDPPTVIHLLSYVTPCNLFDLIFEMKYAKSLKAFYAVKNFIFEN
jgi:hypothetical protein